MFQENRKPKRDQKLAEKLQNREERMQIAAERKPAWVDKSVQKLPVVIN